MCLLFFFKEMPNSNAHVYKVAAPAFLHNWAGLQKSRYPTDGSKEMQSSCPYLKGLEKHSQL